MAYFPQFNGSVITQRPYGKSQAFRTVFEDQPTGKRYAFSYTASPINRFSISCEVLTESDLVVLRNFFDSMRGRYSEFVFLDPGGNLLQYSDDYSQAAWTKNTVTVGGSVSDPFGGTLATTLTGTSSDSYIRAQCIPAGDANGLVICGSAWVKGASSFNLKVGFTTSLGASSYGTTTIPSGKWVRVFHTWTVSDTGVISFNVGGQSSWGAVAMDVFGVRVAPMKGPGGRVKSPGDYGVHAKCRFDTDEFPATYHGPSHTSVSFPVVEYV